MAFVSQASSSEMPCSFMLKIIANSQLGNTHYASDS